MSYFGKESRTPKTSDSRGKETLAPKYCMYLYRDLRTIYWTKTHEEGVAKHED